MKHSDQLLTLSYFAHGDAVQTLAETFHIGRSTLYGIIPEVSQVIFNCLRERHLAFPQGNKWRQIADDFYNIWDFPNCGGALDTQQIEIKKPNHSGTFFFQLFPEIHDGFHGIMRC